MRSVKAIAGIWYTVAECQGSGLPIANACNVAAGQDWCHQWGDPGSMGMLHVMLMNKFPDQMVQPNRADSSRCHDVRLHHAILGRHAARQVQFQAFTKCGSPESCCRMQAQAQLEPQAGQQGYAAGHAQRQEPRPDNTTELCLTGNAEDCSRNLL